MCKSLMFKSIIKKVNVIIKCISVIEISHNGWTFDTCIRILIRDYMLYEIQYEMTLTKGDIG